MEHVGVSKQKASILVAAMSVSEFVVRSIMAVFTGRVRVNNLVFLSATCFLGGVASFSCTAGAWLWLIIIYVLGKYTEGVQLSSFRGRIRDRFSPGRL